MMPGMSPTTQADQEIINRFKVLQEQSAALMQMTSQLSSTMDHVLKHTQQQQQASQLLANRAAS